MTERELEQLYHEYRLLIRYIRNEYILVHDNLYYGTPWANAYDDQQKIVEEVHEIAGIPQHLFDHLYPPEYPADEREREHLESEEYGNDDDR